MAQQQKPQPKKEQQPPPAQSAALATIPPSRLPCPAWVEAEYGIRKSQWRALVESIFPLATSAEAIVLALSYCQARGLDIFKKPCHIVPIWHSSLRRMVDTIWPGIGELRTTAHRTNSYAGCDETVFGPMVQDRVGKTAMVYPEWAQVTVYRIVQGQRCAFPGPRVHYLETYATAGRDTDDPNEMWRNRPNGQLEKCAEAAALRKAFPEEINEFIPEEMERMNGRWSVINTTSTVIDQNASKTQALKDQLKGRLENKPAETLDTTSASEPERETVPANRETTGPEGETVAQQAEPTPEEKERQIAERIELDIGIAVDQSLFDKITGGIACLANQELRDQLTKKLNSRIEELKKLNGGKSPSKDGKLPME